MSEILSVEKVEVETFIAIDSGCGSITLTFIDGRRKPGTDGWATTVQLDKEQAEQLVNLLNARIRTL